MGSVDDHSVDSGGGLQMMGAVLSKTRISLVRATMAACCLALAMHWAKAQETKSADKAKEPQDAVTLSAGRQTFVSICASCHGLDGKGGERGPDIVTRSEITRLGDEEILGILRAGIPEKGMPGFAGLGSEKLSDLLRYVRSLQGNGTAVMPILGDARVGKEVFWGKGTCSECHMVNGSGGFLGPELSKYAENHPAKEIHAAIVSPGGLSGMRRRGAEVTSNDGTVYSGLIRNEDNFSMQLQSFDGSFHLFSKADLASIKYRQEPLMPTDYGSKLSAEEVDALVAYLVEIAQVKEQVQAPQEPYEE